jgi:hypothetical protein
MNRIARLGTALVAALSMFLGGCGDAPEREAAPLPLMASPAAPGGKFLHLSDIHFDVASSVVGGNVAQLASLPVDQWDQHFDAKAAPSANRNDTNFAPLVSALAGARDAATYDFILYTGDYLPHGFTFGKTDAESAAFAAKVVEYVNYKIAEAFPGKPIIGMLGNNDGGCGDYTLHPGGAFLADLAPEMPGVKADPAAQKDFAAYGYYAIRHPTVANTDFIVLSSYWSHNFPGYDHGFASGCARLPGGADPGKDQIDWLAMTIGSGAASPSPRNAILLMHIPPGIDGFSGGDQWADRFEPDFENKLTNASHTILGAFAGHSHMDEFRVLSNSAGPYLAVRVAPSVTTRNGNAPSFTVADYDTKTGAMTDYAVFSLRPLPDGTDGWQHEYTFSQAFGPGGFSPSRLAKLAARIQDNTDTSGARQNYLSFYRARKAPAGAYPGNWQRAICATSIADQADFNACVSAVK